jgi:hypothetical protein
MAAKHKGNVAGNLDMPKQSSKAFFLSKKIKAQLERQYSLNFYHSIL